ncbi:hypothetical protein [Streptomyces sp. TLI_105]|uniref:hypothetical protein n=1 Tax=Streptomyces sp. TLI_105 TaxID=1881019 RepID=UPI00210E618C|nr:hypothetical protein [Streptomyces sp. TLI_105]
MQGAGGGRPVGRLLQATREIATTCGLTTYENAKLFALVAITMADAGIGHRDMKYLVPIDLWRPVSVIRESGLHPERKPLLKNPAGVNLTLCFTLGDKITHHVCTTKLRTL